MGRYDELPIDNSVVAPEACPQALLKNDSELIIMATPVAVPQGQTITFSVNEADYAQPGDRVSYFWVVRGETGNKPEFELDTGNWAEGEHRIRATLHVRSAVRGVVLQVPGSALFTVKAPVLATPIQPGFERPIRAFGRLNEHIRVNHARLNGGELLVVSLAPAFANEQQPGAKLRYFWTVFGHSVGQGTSYKVDTTGFEPGQCLVRVTVHRTELATNKYNQFNGVAVVDILEACEPA